MKNVLVFKFCTFVHNREYKGFSLFAPLNSLMTLILFFSFISVVRKPWNNFQSTFHFYYNPNNIRNMRKSFQGLNCPLYPYFHIAQGRPITFVEYLELVFDLLNRNIPCFFR